MQISRLFNKEFEISENYRWLATTMIVLFAISYSLSFLGLMQYVAYLGPGLGDNLSFSPFIQVFQQFYQSANGGWSNMPLLLFIGLTAANLIFSAAIIIVGYVAYEKLLGKPFPITILFTYFLLNAVCTVGIWSIQILAALPFPIMGFDLITGLMAFDNLLSHLRDWTEQVPTIINMPAWLAFFVLNMAGGFFHYWFHRLAHESRLLWLLFHRTHHMTPELIQPSTQAVFNAFPFFLFAAIPYVVIFSTIGNLITNESLLVYLIIYKLISAFANLFSHQTALYQWAQDKWYIRLLSTITSEGVYHYLHHSAEPEHNNNKGNLVNIGGGLFFFWDRVFGTYQTVTAYRPRVGLWNTKPDEMSTNPLRLAFSGTSQIIFELYHCRSVSECMKIIFGSTAFKPAITKNFVLRANGTAE